MVPQVFVQEIRLTSTKNIAAEVQLIGAQPTQWPNLETKTLKLRQSATGTFIDIRVLSGIVDMPKTGDKLIITIVVQKLPDKIAVRKRGIVKLDVLHVINYALATRPNVDVKQISLTVESQAVEKMTEMLQLNEFHFTASDNSERTVNAFKRQHQRVWNNLWETGFGISTSKADDAINGDRINATIYAVLSQVRSLEFESNSSPQERVEISRALFYAEGCYDSYHTLQVSRLTCVHNESKHLAEQCFVDQLAEQMRMQNERDVKWNELNIWMIRLVNIIVEIDSNTCMHVLISSNTFIKQQNTIR